MSADPHRVVRAIALAVTGIVALPSIAFGIEAAAFVGGQPGLVAVVEGVAPLCHGLVERTLHWDGRPLPVCARCTGLYLGLALGGPLGLALGGRDRARRLALTAAAIAATGLTAATLEALGVFTTPNAVRLGLGLALGLGPALYAGLGARLLLDVRA